MTALLLVASLAPVLPAKEQKLPSRQPSRALFSIYPLGDRPGATMSAASAASCFATRRRSGSKLMAFTRASIVPAPIPSPIRSLHAAGCREHSRDHRCRRPSPASTVSAWSLNRAFPMRFRCGYQRAHHHMNPKHPTGDAGSRTAGWKAFPLVVNGRIAKKGEVDYYWFDAQAR